MSDAVTEAVVEQLATLIEQVIRGSHEITYDQIERGLYVLQQYA